MKIGFYGGTFDPIHHGHLILARAALEYLELDRVIFIPNTISPHRQTHRAAPAALRYEMVAAAIEEEEGFEASDIEIRRSGPSYAFDTMLEMRERHPDAELHYLIGEDNIPALGTWHRFDELTRLVDFVVLNRSGEKRVHPYVTLNLRIDISATEIRNRLAKGLSVRYLVPERVLQIIREHNLYQETIHQS